MSIKVDLCKFIGLASVLLIKHLEITFERR